MRMISIAAAAAAALLVSGVANAATVTKTYNFSATNFALYGGSGPVPTDPVTGSFTVTFDPTVQQFDVSSGISGTINVPYANGLVFTFNPFAGNLMVIGGALSGAAAMNAGDADFMLDFSGALGTPELAAVIVNQGAGTFGSTDVTFTTGSVPGGVPEPATWAMMIAGFGLAGMSLRGRRRAVEA